jgi:hypothetical protein
MSNPEENKFSQLLGLNLNDKTEKKGNLTYLSWAWAWGEFKKVYPGAEYVIKKNETGMPYFSDESGAMVYTEVTVDGLSYEMWLPVMDHRNKALKGDAIDSFAVNKAIMRCLVKNLAMFGLGLYIYAGEDIPDTDTRGMMNIGDSNFNSKVQWLKGQRNKEESITELRKVFKFSVATEKALLDQSNE